MTNLLLDSMLPADLADRSQVIEYKGVIVEFDRLREISENSLAVVEHNRREVDWEKLPVEVKLEFGWLDTDRTIPTVIGGIRAGMAALCQRCLEPFELMVDVPVKVLFGKVYGTAPDNDYDTWESGDTPIRLLDVVEEAVVMALPLAPVHNSIDDCGALAGKIRELERDTARPFAGLRAQLDEMNK